MWPAFIYVGLTFVVCIHVGLCYKDDNASKPIDELLFVHIIFRHGDRNILSTYKNDPWKSEKYWPEGFGQLSNMGKQQHYDFGAYLRRRYSKLLPKDGSYQPDNIYIQSTDVDRTLASAEYCLAGMFPPIGRQIWNESLIWQAIPIHTTPEQLDYVLAMKKPCPLYLKAYAEYEQSDDVQSILRNNQELTDYINFHSGTTFKTIFDLKQLHEVLEIETLRNYTLPAWTRKIYPGGKLKEIAVFSFLMVVNTKLMARLKAGFLIREIFNRFTMKRDLTLSPDRSLWIYSAHDLTIMNILAALDLYESQGLPDYTSSLFFELHKFNGTFYVEIYYRNYHGNDKTALKPLFIPNCGQKCPLNKLFEIYQDVIPTKDFDTECRLPQDIHKQISSSNLNTGYAPVMWLSILLTLLIKINR